MKGFWTIFSETSRKDNIFFAQDQWLLYSFVVRPHVAHFLTESCCVTGKVLAFWLVVLNISLVLRLFEAPANFSKAAASKTSSFLSAAVAAGSKYERFTSGTKPLFLCAVSRDQADKLLKWRPEHVSICLNISQASCCWAGWQNYGLVWWQGLPKPGRQAGRYLMCQWWEAALPGTGTRAAGTITSGAQARSSLAAPGGAGNPTRHQSSRRRRRAKTLHCCDR